MPKDLTDPAVIKFLNENYGTENKLRIRWFYKNIHSVEDAATLHRTATEYTDVDVISSEMYAVMDTLAANVKDNLVNRRKLRPFDSPNFYTLKDIRNTYSLKDLQLADERDAEIADSKSITIPVMRPVDPEESNIIHLGLPYYGRKVYVEKRFRKLPENKFYFNLCSSWDHGWRLKDSFFSRQRAAFGHRCSLAEAYNNRSGASPDPPHYKDPNIPGVSKCLA